MTVDPDGLGPDTGVPVTGGQETALTIEDCARFP